MNAVQEKEPVPIVDGERYRRTHRASVIGILGNKAPPVFSKGSRFYNLDRWTLRFFVSEMCKWAKDNPECIPTKNEIQTWVHVANNTPTPSRCIVIANTPDKLPLRTALALTGGGYHEALHTHLSCRRVLRADEMVALVIPRWALVADWSKYHMALLEWSNIIEDIRIERRGREEFEGTYVPFCDLQDFILGQEAKGEEDLRGHGQKVPALSIIVRTFRDIGLGYNTDLQAETLERYQKEHPQAVDLVIKGPLSPHLRKAIALDRTDDTGCLKLTLEVIAELAKLAGQTSESDKANSGQAGDGKHKCPKCGAPANAIKVRPKSDGKGRKVKGVGIATCTKCGWQDEVEVGKPESGKGKPQEPEDTPQFDGTDEEFDDWFKDEDEKGGTSGKEGDSKEGTEKEGDGTSEGGSEKSTADKSGEGSQKEGKEKDKPEKGKDKSESGKDKGEGNESGEEGEFGDGSGSGEGGSGSGEGSEGAGESGDSAGSEGEGTTTGKGEGEKGQEGGEGEGESSEVPGGSSGGGLGEQSGEGVQGDEQSTDSDTPSNGAGGYHHNIDPHVGAEWNWEEVVTDALKDVLKDLGVEDVNSALEEEVGKANDKADSDIQKSEAVWKPYDPSLDTAEFVKPSARGMEHDRNKAGELTKSVTSETAYLRARLRSVIRSLEMTSTYHGVPKGKGISQRFLVDSKAALVSGQFPKKAYYRKGQQIDMTVATAIVLDESGSMYGILQEASRILVSLTEPFDALHCPTLAIGFRNGRGTSYSSWSRPEDAYGDGVPYHRYNGVHYDIFKMWHERFATVKWRFANTRAEGGTPMSDGIQFALKALSTRDEAHRLMFVITDGFPDGGHEPIIKRQIRLAKEAGIHIVGVGLGDSAVYVKDLFPDYVWARKVPEIPALLVAKLNELIDVYSGKRGKRIKKDA